MAPACPPRKGTASKAAFAVVLQPDGRIVTAGYANDFFGTYTESFWVIARWLP